MAAEQKPIQVSRSRVGEILTNQYLQAIAQLQQQVAELTAVNEALMGRLNDHGSPNGKALSEGINDSQTATPSS